MLTLTAQGTSARQSRDAKQARDDSPQGPVPEGDAP